MLKLKSRSIATLALLAFSAPALAYVPPSQFLVRNVAGKKAGTKGVRVRSIVTAYESDQPTTLRFKVTTLFDSEQNVVRSVAFDEISNAQLYVHERRGEARSTAAVVALLFDHRNDRLTQALVSQGIPIRTEAELMGLADEEARRNAELVYLDRLNRRVAWVVGPKKDAKAQLWIEKDTFLPMALWWKPQDGREVLMDNYKTFGDFPFPRTVSLLERKKILLRDDLVDVLVNPTTLAEYKALVKTPKSAPITVGFTEAGKNASSSLRELIELYFEALR